MKADLTRSTDQPALHYRSVRMQQGRVQLDADWNEQNAIVNRRVETETRDTLGDVAAPLALDGFDLTVSGGNIAISPGRIYLNGLLCENAAAATLISQPSLPGNVSPIIVTSSGYLGLPPAGAVPLTSIQNYGSGGALAAPADGVYVAYIETWLRHITALEDPLIREVALGGPDSATRDQLVWQIKLLDVGAVSPAPTCATPLAPWDALIKPPDGTLGARAEPGATATDLCLLTPEAGYRSLENQLYRVEIHDDGSGGGKARFKWSRDNGCIVSTVVRWLNDPTANEFEVASIGRDAYLSISAGCWVEFYDDTHELLGLAGTLVKVTRTAGNVVTVDLTTATGPLDQPLFASNPRVRRWDDLVELTSKPAAAAYADGWIALENGVQVRFVDGHFRVGDYWTIPARTATSDVLWPAAADGKALFMAPEGTLRAFGKLALFACSGGVWSKLDDCRAVFPTLSQLTNLFYVGGDGQSVLPDSLNPASNVALPKPLEVAVFNGQFPVANASVSFVVTEGALAGGGLSAIATTTANGIASVSWSLANSANLTQTCVATLLASGAPVSGKYNQIHFNAQLSVAAQVAYDPAKCPDMTAAKINTVQAAIDALCAKGGGGGGGCCVTVGLGGQYGDLQAALLELSKPGSEVCLCLLPGLHVLSKPVSLAGDSKTHLAIHGIGPGAQLQMDALGIALSGYGSVALQDFDAFCTGDGLPFVFDHCDQVRLEQVNINGLKSSAGALVTVGGARQITVQGCTLRAWQTAVSDTLDMVIARIPLLESLRPICVEAALWLPVSLDAARAFLAFISVPDQARLLASQIGRATSGDNAIRPMTLYRALRDLDEWLFAPTPPDAPALALAMAALRFAIFMPTAGTALALQDAEGDVLLADSHIDGHLLCYGSQGTAENLQALISQADKQLRTGSLRWVPTQGQLRLRNDRVWQINLADEYVQTAKQQLAQSGALPRAFRSLVASDCAFNGAGPQYFLAWHIALTDNLVEATFSFVGYAMAMQGKYLGNMAEACTLYTAGHNAEAFGNGGMALTNAP
ncbi:DUF6519 domain-containing protein [Amantichitinum ursilacus]|uniref:Uncharacterized protein n=1 Tax=Amantichitinum ursilacus TaxID=857265 RepID=A0A0N0GN56_9NEIS|nr:DUF6519 domain-containing protein [Amantichitinum ursilacus]KPC52482.1 hypothetical protein WG78_11575 [Amantichitinum ursilacus]